jgi:putative spermidine/putrescine transport system ATP-binding protein
MSSISFNGVSKAFGRVQAVRDCHLDVEDRSVLAILGPSGCGKTTLLRMLAGFLRPDRGRIFLGTEDVTDLPPFRRNLGFVFQSYALFPHLTVAENLAFGLKMRRLGGAEIAGRTRQYLDLVQLGHAHERYPDELSGGQQQRVALARALSVEPDVLLLDEPLSALDRKLREEMQGELKSLQRTVGVTTILVTHDQEEALTIADRIVVMSEGQIEQIGTPEEIYEAPRTRFVAKFVGTANFIEGKLHGTGSFRSDCGRTFVLDPALLDGHGADGLLIRPEKIRVHDEPPAGRPNLFAARVTRATYQGQQTRLDLDVDGLTLTAVVPNLRRANRAYAARSHVYLEIDPGAFSVLRPSDNGPSTVRT